MKNGLYFFLVTMIVALSSVSLEMISKSHQLLLLTVPNSKIHVIENMLRLILKDI